MINIKRPAIYIFLLQILGVVLSDTRFRIVVAILSLAICSVLILKNRKHRTLLVMSIVIFLIALFPIRSEVISQDIYGNECLVSGYISGDISKKNDTNSCVFRIREINGEKIRTKIRISFKSGNSYFEENLSKMLSFKCIVEKPKGARNPGGFDYADYLHKRGILGTSYIGDGTIINVEKDVYSNILIVWGRNIRKEASKRVKEAMPSDEANVLTAMTFGDEETLDESYEEKFREAGVSHILVVSGGNVLVISTMIFFLLKLLKVKRKTRIIFCILGIFVFIMICGFSVSAVRGGIMATIMLTSFLVLREKDSISSLMVSGIIILILMPYSIYDVSFLLSFSSVLSIILLNPIIMEKFSKVLPKWLVAALSVSLSAQIGTIPIVIYYFNTLNLMSIITNVLIAPIFSVVPIIGIILALFGGVLEFTSFITGPLVSIMLKIIDVMSRVSSFLIPDPSVLSIIAYYVGVAIVFLKMKKFKFVNLIFVLVLSYFILITPYYFSNNKAKIYFLDVGQGDSIFIQTNDGKNILIDGGGKEGDDSSGKKTAENVLIPLFMSKGITKLDYVFVTHDHADHYGGIEGLKGKIGMNKIFLPPQYSYERRGNLIGEIIELSLGDKIKVNNEFFFEVYNPRADKENIASNNTSLVLKLTYGNLNALFTGDIEEEGENELNGVDTDILKVAHHGSKTSSSERFLDKANAKTAVISVGKNSFGHPSGEVLDRLEEFGIDIYRTDQMGCVIISLEENEYMIERFCDE